MFREDTCITDEAHFTPWKGGINQDFTKCQTCLFIFFNIFGKILEHLFSLFFCPGLKCLLNWRQHAFRHLMYVLHGVLFWFGWGFLFRGVLCAVKNREMVGMSWKPW